MLFLYTTEKRKEGSRMKKRKGMAVLGVMLGLGMMMTGCGKTPETASTLEVQEISMEETAEEKPTAQDTDNEEAAEEKPTAQDADSAEEDEPTKQDTDREETAEEEPTAQDTDSTAEEEQKGQKIDFAEGEEHLGGKVQNPLADGMTLAKTTVMEGNSVILLEEKDAEKIPVQFTADTKIERWTIQGGGANIDMKEAAVSDLKAGMGVELVGRFEGETFVASKVIIEEYS